MKGKYTWYVEAITINETLARELPETNAQRNIKCAGGEKRNLWECQNHTLITKLKGMGFKPKRDFNIYVQSGNGLPKLFLSKRRRH